MSKAPAHAADSHETQILLVGTQGSNDQGLSGILLAHLGRSWAALMALLATLGLLLAALGPFLERS